MGITQSEPDYDTESAVDFLVKHKGLGSQWAKFALRRYGIGLGPTGVPFSIALPCLLRCRLHDWAIQGCKVQLGKNFVRWGRKMLSRSKEGAEIFFGVTVYFGEHDRASWLWYCPFNEWCLQLHKAIIEPLPPLPATPESEIAARPNSWPGRPHFLNEPRHAGTSAKEGKAQQQRQQQQQQQHRQGDADAAGGGPSGPSSKCEDEAFPDGEDQRHNKGEAVTHQLSLFLGNADGHIGVLTLPVPTDQVSGVSEAVDEWERNCEVPLFWSGRLWHTAEDFKRLRETALFIPDVMMLGMETDLAMALSPDWTWERYPRGSGEAAFPDAAGNDSSDAISFFG